MNKIGQPGEFLGRILGPILKNVLPLIGNVLEPLAKSVLIPLGLTAAVSATDAAVHKKMFGSGNMTLTISNEEMNDIIKTVKSLEEYGLLIKGVSGTIKNEAKEQKGRFLGMLLATLGDSLLGNLLTSKGTSMLPHSLTNFEIQKVYQNESKFSGVYSRNNLPTVKDGTYIINLYKFNSIESYWIALYINGINGRTSYTFMHLYISTFR